MSFAFETRPRFVESGSGRLFLLEFACVEKNNGFVVCVPPFAEEMNRCRRMMSLQGRSLAAAGFNVLIADLFGTGDSDGDFGEATWDIWLDNVVRIIDEFTDESRPLILWPIRVGCLLAAEAISKFDLSPDRLVMWSPVVRGDAFVTQFLRVKSLSQKLAGDGPVETVADLRSQLTAGRDVEVAGYTLTPALLSALGSRDIDALLSGYSGRVDWLEMVSSEGRFPAPAVTSCASGLSDAGVKVFLDSAIGPNFWSTAEIAAPITLIEKTTRCVNAGFSR